MAACERNKNSSLFKYNICLASVVISADAVFQSTLSVRRATARRAQAPASIAISIHALREESDRSEKAEIEERTRFQSTLSVRRTTIVPSGTKEITTFQSTLSVRRATQKENIMILLSRFQSTLSVRRATKQTSIADLCLAISIHALREESDLHRLGEVGDRMLFQSTLSVRRATQKQVAADIGISISIHALREESDLRLIRLISGSRYFNPRSP